MKSLTPLATERRDTMKRNYALLAVALLAASTGLFGQRESPPLSDAVRLAVLEERLEQSMRARIKQDDVFDQRLDNIAAQVAENRSAIMQSAGRSGGVVATGGLMFQIILTASSLIALAVTLWKLRKPNA